MNSPNSADASFRQSALTPSGVIAAFASALALTGVCSNAMAFPSRIGDSHVHTSQEESGSCCGDSGTGFRSDFHAFLQTVSETMRCLQQNFV